MDEGSHRRFGYDFKIKNLIFKTKTYVRGVFFCLTLGEFKCQ